jgi:membrane protease YdiL (CAAX protease family)
LSGTLNKSMTSLPQWLTAARGGWMRHHIQAVRVTPWWFSQLTVTVQLSCEEIIFRAVLIPVLSANVGTIRAVLISTLLFTTMQAVHTPNWRTALFPMIGGAVMGMVHGLVFAIEPAILPLIVAHLIFFELGVVW